MVAPIYILTSLLVLRIYAIFRNQPRSDFTETISASYNPSSTVGAHHVAEVQVASISPKEEPPATELPMARSQRWTASGLGSGEANTRSSLDGARISGTDGDTRSVVAGVGGGTESVRGSSESVGGGSGSVGGSRESVVGSRESVGGGREDVVGSIESVGGGVEGDTESVVGSREDVVGSREDVVGSRESEVGSRESGMDNVVSGSAASVGENHTDNRGSSRFGDGGEDSEPSGDHGDNATSRSPGGASRVSMSKLVTTITVNATTSMSTDNHVSNVSEQDVATVTLGRDFGRDFARDFGGDFGGDLFGDKARDQVREEEGEEEKKQKLTIMALFPMTGTAWPAGYYDFN